MARPLKVVLVGLGPIGQGIAKLVLGTEGLQVVGATDPSPQHAGKDLGVVLGLPRKLRIKVAGDPARFVRKSRADLAILCTGSSLKDVKPQIAALVQRGMNVVTHLRGAEPSPPPANQSHFRELDRLAQRKKVIVLGTGVNPGYAMDTLALVLTAPCARVKRIAVTRVVDAGSRRLPLQRKVGAGLNLSQFRRARDRELRPPRGPRRVRLHDRARTGLEARPRGRDHGARDRPPRPRHRVPAVPGGSGGGDQAVRPGLPGRRARDQPRPPDVRGGGIPARPRARGRRSPHRRHDRRGGWRGTSRPPPSP